MLVKLETYKIDTGQIISTDYIVTDSAQRAMAMISEADDEDVRYHICDPDEERAFFASRMGGVKSTAKTQAARENGRKGGRPRKAPAG